MPTRRDPEANCTLSCFACDRPRDNFKHVHIQRDDASQPQFALCIPCLASLSFNYSTLIEAYANGGHMFDDTMRERVRKRLADRKQKPPSWLKGLLDEIDAKEGDESNN